MAKQLNAPLPNGSRVGRYRILKKLSSGGFSVVYLAETEQGEAVALKEYLPSTLALRSAGEFAPQIAPKHLNTFKVGLKCFFEEGRALARIVHPNIVRVLDFIRENETVYLVMQYEAGRSLQEHIIKRRGMREWQTVEEHLIGKIFVPLMNGLSEVHRHELLHLDIKPANIYLRMDDSPLLLDFGAARQRLGEDANRPYPMYTPGFAPPEMYRKPLQLGPWSDLYSVGASLYACVTGHPPQPADLRLSGIDRVPAKLDGRRGAYDDSLIDLIRWCLSLDMTQRPQSVAALQRALIQLQPAKRNLRRAWLWLRARQRARRGE